MEEVVAEANSIDATAYTAESYAVLAASVNEANKVLANENVTQEEVDVPANAVRTAIDGLVAVEGTTVEETTTPNDGNGDGAIQAGQTTITTKTNAAKTGDFATIPGLAAITLAGAALLLTRKKK